MIDEGIRKIRETIFKERKIMKELNSLVNYNSLLGYLKNEGEKQEKDMIEKQIEKLKESLRKVNDELLENLNWTTIQTPLIRAVPKSEGTKKFTDKEDKLAAKKYKEEISELDKEILKRLKKKRGKIVEKKEKKPSAYIKAANNFFAVFVKSLIKEKKIIRLEKDLIKSNLGYTSITYISILILTTILSVIIAIFMFSFFLLFDIGSQLPIVTRATEGIGIRFLKVFWILFAVPIGTFLFMYLYPSLERKSLENKINQELPFATIHMSAISGSMIEPTKVFSIISSTKEYPYLEKEFNKLLNEINVYGYDIVSALKNLATNCPSQKLAELFNGLATTITSGGGLYEFFEKRSQTMIFEYRLDKEKRTKTAETFMDIYISVVIAAPMILMLLLMMMKISGVGVAMSTPVITLLIVGGVSLINIMFLVFLQVKQPETM